MTPFEYVRRHAKAYTFGLAVITLAGVYLAFHLPVSLFPDITFPRIVILADNGEQPAERIMIEVTKPLEEIASSVPGVKLVRSITGRGSTEISLGLNWGTDIQQALQILDSRIADARNTLPLTASIQALQMSVAVFPILGYSLTSDKLDQVALRDIAYYPIRPAIMQVDGVARVEVTGGETREYSVIVDPQKLAAYRLDIRQISEAIQKTNLVAATGLIDNNYQIYLSLVSGLLSNTDDLSRVVVAVQNGVPIRVGDVADVKPSVAPVYIRTTAHGVPAVLINVIKQPTGSTVKIGDDVKATVSRLTLPPGLRFENWYDQADFIKSSILSTRDSILVGIILSMVVLLIFLRSWRVTLIMALVVPITIGISLAVLYVIGESINIMTLGGIAAAVGLIIDDSIVVIENIFVQFKRRKDEISTDRSFFAQASMNSLKELSPAIIGSTASTVVMNIPLAFLGGVTGAFFSSLSKAMIIALLVSFVLSITLCPLLASLILKVSDIRYEIADARKKSRFSEAYVRTLRWLLKYRMTIIPTALVILASSYLIYTKIGSGFMPEMDEGTFVLDYTSPAGTSLDETNNMLMKVEQILMNIAEVDSYSRRTGTQLGFFLTEPNTGDFLVKLKKKRSRSIDDVINEVRKRVESSVPSLVIDFGQLMMDVIGDLTNTPKPVEIKLFGEDTKLLQIKADEAARLIENVPGVVDVFNGIVISGPSFVINVDPTKAASFGLTAEDVQGQIKVIMEGATESEIPKNEKLIPIRVHFPDIYRHDVDRIENIQLINNMGIFVPLNSVATVEKTTGQAEIDREGLRQFVAVSARIEGRDLGHTVNDIKRVISAKLNIPKNVALEYGGVYQTQQDSFRDLVMVAIVAFVLVFMVLLFEFGDFAVPISVLVISILSLVGVVSALWITGTTFNISSFVGLIMIIGIVAENGIFVIHQVKLLRADGTDLDSAIVEASRMRVRPIMMTTLAAILALMPLALGMGAGAQMQKPLAIAVIGGFTISSLLLFFGLPLVYRLLKGSN